MSVPYRLYGTIKSGNSWWIFSHCLHLNLLMINRWDSPASSRNFRSREPMILYSVWLQQGQGTFSAHRMKNAFWGAFFYDIMRDDYHIFLEDVSRRATGNSRHHGRRLFLSPELLRTLYPSILGQTIPSTFGHYETALTERNAGKLLYFSLHSYVLFSCITQQDSWIREIGATNV